MASCLPRFCVHFCQVVPAADFSRLKLPLHEANVRNNVELHLNCQFVFDLTDVFQCMFKNAQIYPPFFPVARLPNADRGLILEVYRSNITTHHSRLDSSGRMISSLQKPLPDNTQNSQQTKSLFPAGFEPTISADERTQIYVLRWVHTCNVIAYRNTVS